MDFAISDLIVLMMVAGATGYMLRMFAPSKRTSGGCSTGGNCSSCGACSAISERLAIPHD